MKYLQCFSGLLLIALLSSFVKHEDKQAPDKHVGHVKSIRRVEYHATMDSAGNIFKGDIISDTDIVIGMKDNKYMHPPVGIRGNGSEVPIEFWMYDEKGNTIENDKYHANGRLYHKIVDEYNGAQKAVEYDTSYNKNGSERTTFSAYEYNTNAKITQERYVDCAPDRPCYYTINRFLYDAKGFQSEILFIDSAGTRWSPSAHRQVYVLDSAEHIIENLYFEKDSTDLTHITLCRYNKEGELIETDYENKKEVKDAGPLRRFALMPEWKEMRKYDDKGRLVNRIKYLPGNLIKEEEKTFYDSAGKRVENYRYDDAGHFQGTDVKTVFKNDHTVLEDKYDIDGMLLEYSVTHLDSAGNLMDKGTLHVRYKGIMGNDRRYHNQPPGDTVMVNQVVNNEHGDRTEEDTYSPDGKISMQKTWEYNYDSTGNWAQRIYLENGKPLKIVEREITYY